MGPGILTRYSKQVLGTLFVLAAIVIAVVLYFQHRGPVGDETPYGLVNDYGTANPEISIAAEETVYPVDVETVRVTVSLGEDLELLPEEPRTNDWLLEVYKDGGWYSMRTFEEHIRWDFPAEDKSANGGPSGILMGQETQTFLCNIAEYYELPLEAGTYRIVFPDMTLYNAADDATWSRVDHMAMAAEFEVQ